MSRVRVAMVAVACLALIGAACGGGGSFPDEGSVVVEGSSADTSVGEPMAMGIASSMQPQLNGWAFPNFPSATFPDFNFDAADLVSMFGNGPDVCVDGVAEPCTLTAEAAAWARMVNQARSTGHCEGLVALASARYNRAELPETVKLPSTEDEIRAVMRAFATQFVPEVQTSIEKWTKASLVDKVEELKQSFASDKLKYTLGMYVEGGGHAVLPYAIEYPSVDVVRVMVYDSNWPGRNRYVDVDLAAGTWTFSFAADDPASDPSPWTGEAGEMDLTPFEAREGTCPFCGDDSKVRSTTLLVRTENLDWSVETAAGAVSPKEALNDDGVTARPVKGRVAIVRMAPPSSQRDAYDYVVTVPSDLLGSDEQGSPKSTNNENDDQDGIKLNFGGEASVFAVLPNGVAEFTTRGSKDKPVRIKRKSIRATDPNVDLTLASGNLVANASGDEVELGIGERQLNMRVTTSTGRELNETVTPDKPTVQVKSKPNGETTIISQEVGAPPRRIDVAPNGNRTEAPVPPNPLNLNRVEAILPPALASKPIPALPQAEARTLSNPDYRTDAPYVPPTSIGTTSTLRVSTSSTLDRPGIIGSSTLREVLSSTSTSVSGPSSTLKIASATSLVEKILSATSSSVMSTATTARGPSTLPPWTTTTVRARSSTTAAPVSVATTVAATLGAPTTGAPTTAQTRPVVAPTSSISIAPIPTASSVPITVPITAPASGPISVPPTVTAAPTTLIPRTTIVTTPLLPPTTAAPPPVVTPTPTTVSPGFGVPTTISGGFGAPIAG